MIIAANMEEQVVLIQNASVLTYLLILYFERKHRNGILSRAHSLVNDLAFKSLLY